MGRSTGDVKHIVVDSTGLKVFGEGEWKVREHGYSKRRRWRKLHLAVDVDGQSLVAAAVTSNDFHDSELLEDLLEQIPEETERVSADGGYDTRESYEAVLSRGAKPFIVPRRNAVIEQHGNCTHPPLIRDEHLRWIRKRGRRHWKFNSGYSKRSLAETAMFRYKTLFGEQLNNHLFEHQATEALIQCRAMNIMTPLGIPDSYAVTV